MKLEGKLTKPTFFSNSFGNQPTTRYSLLNLVARARHRGWRSEEEDRTFMGCIVKEIIRVLLFWQWPITCLHARMCRRPKLFLCFEAYKRARILTFSHLLLRPTVLLWPRQSTLLLLIHQDSAIPIEEFLRSLRHRSIEQL